METNKTPQMEAALEDLGSVLFGRSRSASAAIRCVFRAGLMPTISVMNYHGKSIRYPDCVKIAKTKFSVDKKILFG